MSQSFITHDMVSKIYAATLTNKAVGLNLVTRDREVDFKPSGKGDTIKIRVPAKLAAYDGPNITGTGDQQVLEESYVSLRIEKDTNVPVIITNKEMTLEIEDFKKQVADQQVIPMADAWDTYILGTLPLLCPNIVGTPGVPLSNDRVISDAGVRLDELGCPADDRHYVLNPKGTGGVAQYIKAICNPEIAGDALRRGFVGRASDMQFWKSNNIARHTNGSFNGTPIVKGASQTGSSVIVDGIGGAFTGFLKKGDIITFAGCYAVKPVNGEALPYLRQFVVTADVDSVADNTGEATVPISPAIVVTGPGKTCSASPTNDGAVKLFGAASQTYARNIACHKNAMAFAAPPLRPLDGGSNSHTSSINGVSILYTAGDDVKARQTIKRIDSIYGGLLVNPNMMCLIAAD